jgi:hypothetical protein
MVSACQGQPPSAETVRLHLESEVPGAEFRRDSHVRLGRFTMALAKGVMRVVAFEDKETRNALSHIKRVDVASYEVVAMPELDSISLPGRFERRLTRLGWYPMVKTREEDSRTWVYYREDGAGSISNLYIVELDSAELTVIDLAGRLDRLTAELVAEDPDGFVAGLGP